MRNRHNKYLFDEQMNIFSPKFKINIVEGYQLATRKENSEDLMHSTMIIDNATVLYISKLLRD